MRVQAGFSMSQFINKAVNIYVHKRSPALKRAPPPFQDKRDIQRRKWREEDLFAEKYHPPKNTAEVSNL